jgi:hypothetical protein
MDSYLETDGARTADDNEQAPFEMAFCSRCKDNANFVKDEDGEWVSECCGWPAIPVDVADDYVTEAMLRGDFNLDEMEED